MLCLFHGQGLLVVLSIHFIGLKVNIANGSHGYIKMRKSGVNITYESMIYIEFKQIRVSLPKK